MEYSVEILEKKGIIISRVKGELHPKETAAMGLKVRQQAIENGYKVILNFSKTKNYVSIIQGHTWFADFYDQIDPNIKFVPTAHIINEEEQSFWKFIETSWSNKGALIKAFKDEKSAIQWLESLDL